MSKETRHGREPLLYVSRRGNVSLSRSISVRVVAILLALIVCAVVTKLMTGDDPISIFKTIAHGALGTGRTLVTIHDIAILLCISLAVTPAFRMKFWNTGAEGQVLIGCLSTAVCMLTSPGARLAADNNNGGKRYCFRNNMGRYPCYIQGAVGN